MAACGRPDADGRSVTASARVAVAVFPALGIVRGVLREHALLLGLVLGYVAGVAVFHAATGQWQRWHILLLPPRMLWITLSACAVLLGLEALFTRGRLDLSARRVLSAVLVLALAVPMQSSFHAYKQTLNVVRPFTWDAELAKWDAALHGGWHPWQLLHGIAETGWLTRAIDVLYFLWLPVLFLFVVWLAWHRDRALRQRTLVTLVLLWVVLGTFLAYGFSSAGPCFFYQWDSGGRESFGPLMQTLRAHHAERPLLALDIQHWLWFGYENRIVMPFGGISAMPSLHVAVAALIGLSMWASQRWLGLLAGSYALAIQAGSVVLGWHYAIDGYLSALIAYGLWFAVPRLIVWFQGPRTLILRKKCPSAGRGETDAVRIQ